MKKLTICQATFTDLTEPVVSNTAPAKPYKGQSWTDTSKSPPVTKIWDGSKWVDRLSEAEQTIKTHTEKLSSQAAEIAQNKADIALRVTKQDYESFKTTVNEEITSAKSRLTASESSIKTMQGQIALKVEQTDIDSAVETVNKKFSSYSTTTQMTAAITAAKNSITSSVSQTYATKSEVSTVSGKVSSLETWKAEASQKITKDGIIATVGSYYAKDTDLTAAESRITTAESKITQNANNINLRVEKSGVISAINQSAESIQINAKKIDLAGYVTVTNLSTAGQTVINGSNITTGTISADRIDAAALFSKTVTATNLTVTGNSNLAGWVVTTGGLYKESGNYTAFLMNGTNTNKDYLVVRVKGSDGSYTWPFVVRADGTLQSSKASITGEITATSITARNTYYIHNTSGTKKEAISAPDASFGSSLNIGAGFSAVYLKGVVINPANYSGGLLTVGDDMTGGILCGTITASKLTASGEVSGSNLRATTFYSKGHSRYENYSGGCLWNTTFGTAGIVTLSNGANLQLYIQKSGTSSWTDSIVLADTNGINIAAKNHTHSEIVSTDGLYRIRFASTANIIPMMVNGNSDGSANNIVSLGSTANYYKNIYYGNVCSKVSDRRDKNLLGYLSDTEALALLNDFQAIKYTSKTDAQAIPQYGAYAQDVRDTLNKSGIGYTALLNIWDVNADCETTDLLADESTVKYGLDYTQYIPVIITGWQYHETELKQSRIRETALEEQLRSAQAQLQQLQAQIQQLQVAVYKVDSVA